MLNESQVRTKRAAFLRRFDVEYACQDLRLVADDADGLAVDTRKAAYDGLCPVLEIFEELAVVDDVPDQLGHVIRQVR